MEMVKTMEMRSSLLSTERTLDSAVLTASTAVLTAPLANLSGSLNLTADLSAPVVNLSDTVTDLAPHYNNNNTLSASNNNTGMVSNNLLTCSPSTIIPKNTTSDNIHNTCKSNLITDGDRIPNNKMSDNIHDLYNTNNTESYNIIENCSVCRHGFLTDMIAIECSKCNCWYHTSCVKVTKTHLKTIKALGNAIHWFCPKCIPVGDQSNINPNVNTIVNRGEVVDVICGGTNGNDNNSLSDMIYSQSIAIKEIQTQMSLLLLHKVDIQQPINKAGSTGNTMQKTFSNALSNSNNNVAKPQSKPKFNTSNSGNLPKPYDPNITLVLNGASDKSLCCNRSAFMQEMSNLFPKTKLVSSSLKPNGLIFLIFTDQAEAQRIVDGWKQTHFGLNTSIGFYKPQNNAIILKNVLQSIPDSEILNSLQDKYPSCTEVIRFKKDNKVLPVVKAIFANSNDVCKVLKEGALIGNLYILPEVYKAKKCPTRCFNCSRFGHTATFCKSKPTCSKCSGDHKSAECTNNSCKKCINCGNDHTSYDKACPVYVKIFNSLNHISTTENDPHFL